MLTDEDREYILDEFLKNILHISDKKYQERIWIRGEGPECDDFTETVCHFFDDGNPILAKYKDYKISEDQYQLLKKFHDEFEAFADSDEREYLEKDFIDTSEWTRITEMAKEVLEAFNYRSE
ncbi:MAG: hypothetical protein V4494_02925 [Chlamydiota bacterium]